MRREMINAAEAFRAICLLMLSLPLIAVEPCRPLTPQQRVEIERFLSKWYELTPTQMLSLVESSAVDSTCYRKLVFRANVPAPLLTLYLAPDGKHLVSGVMDLGVDPSITHHKNQEQLNAQLTANALLTSPESTAPIKVVVFSDFQCPYCKRFSNIVHQLTAEERARVQIIYRQFPLSIHPWARDAAEITECVALQDKSAFWKLHDFLFAHQQEFSKDTLQSRSLDFLSHETKISSKAILTCLNEKRFDDPLREDEQLAIDLGINATPSVFVNGRRATFRSVEELRAALHTAISETSEATACSPGTTTVAACVRRK
jgi:protein-disulfide isomerase